MRSIAIAASAALLLAGCVTENPMRQGALRDAKVKIGTRHWISSYGYVYLCDKPRPLSTLTGNECQKIEGRGSYVLTDAVLPYEDHSIVFAAKMDDGREGYIGLSLGIEDVDPAVVARQEKAKTAAYVRDCLKKGVPRIGMTREQIIDGCWGPPQQNNRTITANGVREQFVYRYRNSYIYLTNGIVDAIQD